MLGMRMMGMVMQMMVGMAKMVMQMRIVMNKILRVMTRKILHGQDCDDVNEDRFTWDQDNILTIFLLLFLRKAVCVRNEES